MVLRVLPPIGFHLFYPIGHSIAIRWKFISTVKSTCGGIPQVSILGRLLLLLYINGKIKQLKSTKILGPNA